MKLLAEHDDKEEEEKKGGSVSNPYRETWPSAWQIVRLLLDSLQETPSLSSNETSYLVSRHYVRSPSGRQP